MRFLLSSFSAAFRDARVREFLLWCLPALVLGLGLRVALMAQLPYAYYHDDTPDFLVTPDKLLNEGKLELHNKKTFLTPTVFTIPFLLGMPALVAIPVGHHLLGLVVVGLIGLLVRLWFVHWKWFIVPITVLAAVNPFFLWYEHTLMAETQFIACTLLVAVTGTLYAAGPGWWRFGWLCASLFLVAGARPEGKLLFGFGFALLLLMHARELRATWSRLVILLALALATNASTKTSQAGLLLYTSVARLTPTDMKCAPGLEPFILPIRTELERRWAEKPSFPRVRDRRVIAGAVKDYLIANHPAGDSVNHRAVNAFCLKLAMETCRRNVLALPELAYHKFRFVSHESPAGLLNNAWLFDKQREAYRDSLPLVMRLAEPLLGQKISSEAEMDQFIDQNYGAVPWLNELDARWRATVNAWRLPDRNYAVAGQRRPFFYGGVPAYFLLAAAGLIAVMLRRGRTPGGESAQSDGARLRAFHVAWGLTMLGFFFVIMLTGNVRPRFRFVFEPFWFLYAGLLLETIWLAVAGMFSPKTGDPR